MKMTVYRTLVETECGLSFEFLVGKVKLTLSRWGGYSMVIGLPKRWRFSGNSFSNPFVLREDNKFFDNYFNELPRLFVE